MTRALGRGRAHNATETRVEGISGRVGSELEQIAVNRIERAGLPAPVLQFRFCPSRRFRLDLAWPEQRVAVEVHGGTWSGGRHVRGKGYESDCEKASIAAAMGWRLLPVTRDMVEDGRMVDLLRRALDLG